MRVGPTSKAQKSGPSAIKPENEKPLSKERILEANKQSFRDFLEKRLEDVQECIAALGIRNNPPHSNPSMPSSIITHEDQKLFVVRVAMLPILLEAIAGDEKCQKAYEELRPIIGVSIDSEVKKYIISLSPDGEFGVRLTRKSGSSSSDLDLTTSQRKAAKAVVENSVLTSLNRSFVRSIGALSDAVLSCSVDSRPEDFTSKAKDIIADIDSELEISITVRFAIGPFYPQILADAVVDDLSLYTTSRAKDKFKGAQIAPKDLIKIQADINNLLFNSDLDFTSSQALENKLQYVDLYRKEERDQTPSVVHENLWGFLKDPKMKSFLRAIDEANVYCWQKSFPDGVRKMALDRYLKRFDLESMMEYLEGESDRQSLAAASAPKPKEEKITPATSATSDPALDLRVKVPESILAHLQQNFPDQKASEVLKVGRRIVEDGLRYNASESDLLELIARFKGLSLKDVGYKIHSVLSEQGLGGVAPTSGEPRPIEKKEGGMKLSEALEKSVILLLKNAPDFKVGQHSITEELSKVPGSQPEEEITRYLNEGLLIPTGEGDELMLNPAYWD